MSWKLRWAGWNRGKKRIYRDDGSYFYDDPSKYPPEEPQYTKKQLKELEELDRREKELEEESKRLQIKIEKNELKIQEYQQKYKQLEREEKIQKKMYRELKPNYKHLDKDELMVMCHPDIDLKNKRKNRKIHLKKLEEFGRSNISGKMHYREETGQLYVLDKYNNKIYIDDF